MQSIQHGGPQIESARSSSIKPSDRIRSCVEWGADIALLLAVGGCAALIWIDGHALPYPLWPWSPLLGLGVGIGKMVTSSWKRTRGVALATLAMASIVGIYGCWVWYKLDLSAIDAGLDLGTTLGVAAMLLAMVMAYLTYMMNAIAQIPSGSRATLD